MPTEIMITNLFIFLCAAGIVSAYLSMVHRLLKDA